MNWNRSAKLIREPRSTTYGIILGTWAIASAYAVVHDQIVVWIAPEHFTEYHDRIGSIASPWLLAMLWALAASFGPGLILGILCAIVGRNGLRPKIPVVWILGGVAMVVLFAETASAVAGAMAWRTERPVFPAAWYPELSSGILITQSMQIMAYLGCAAGSGILLIWLALRRRNP